ncbi:hypothetical protein ZIOFF_014728 [Zingiber officinale]|uniref:Pentatricopeptide repeat-containing protein n=1 Tax=Zingiber officinale TaxID=94328 RepID=A0A8J5LEI6_ZINOF|nr:hypothetical protein ZIOFF_014728 [Zingiber officinale]
MAMRNLVSWNALIVGIVYNKLYYDEMEAFRSVLNDDGLLTPNQVSLSNMLSTCSNVCSIGFWRVVHDLAVKLTVESSLAYVRNSLIDMYCKYACGCFLHMVGEGVFPDETSFCTLLQALAMLASWGQGAAVHYLIVKTRCTQNQCVGSSLITMYAKCCCLEVIKLFDEMMDLGIDPNCITFVSVLSYCNHNELVDQGFKYYTCMVDLLGRAGHLDEAMQFIDAMPIHPDSSVWGALLAACRKFKNLELSSKVFIACRSRVFHLRVRDVNYLISLGVAEVINRWDQGILGVDGNGIPPMLCTLQLPPELGYGARGAGCRGGQLSFTVFRLSPHLRQYFTVHLM